MKKRFESRIAVYLVLEKENSILLACRKNTGFADGMYSLVSDHLEEGETLTSSPS